MNFGNKQSKISHTKTSPKCNYDLKGFVKTPNTQQ